VEGNATEEALAAVAAAFGVRPSSVSLIAGATGRTKVVDVVGGDPHILADLLHRSWARLAVSAKVRKNRDLMLMAVCLIAVSHPACSARLQTGLVGLPSAWPDRRDHMRQDHCRLWHDHLDEERPAAAPYSPRVSAFALSTADDLTVVMIASTAHPAQHRHDATTSSRATRGRSGKSVDRGAPPAYGGTDWPTWR
jgi:hypothetical protein